eukprot:TRINITY_DN10907_c0_g1_i5.p1 TRINITY_DN10907_c0_g1~~TRINITY_DN10907_c0_g1_i5.p1  ORF type:complete len:396 (-),score=103.36 TRINITY_DN10907_c0_g1_i5:337-1524(-)
MAPVNVTVRVTAQDNLEVEVDDSETVEALGVVIFSLRPELGESLRIIYKGKLLNDGETLAASGVKDKDTVAVARKPPAAPGASNPPKLEAPPRVVPATPDPAQPPTHPVALAAAPATDAAPAPPASALPAAASEAAPATTSAVAVASTAAEESPAQTAAVAQPAEAVAQDAGKEEAGNAEAVPASPAGASQMSLTRQASLDSQASVNEDYTTTAGLLSLARRLDADGAAASPEQTAHALRTAAEKIQSLEGVVRECLQSLHMMNIVSGTALQRALGADGGEGGSSLASALASKQEADSGRSFMIKKGDHETAELHAAASSQRPSMASGIVGGGALSSTPTSREEMEKARKARLAKLEDAQREKKKEMADAEEKSKSREAMFNRPNVGPAQPLGKH